MKVYRDHYFLKAKQENYPARSVYKLKELDAKFKLLKAGQKVLDLGAAPGSWSLFTAQRVGAKGLVVACDLNPIKIDLPSQVSFYQTDVFNQSDEFKATLASLAPFDLVLSDMAPLTMGHKFTDQIRSLELATEAFLVAKETLKVGGHFIVKIFMGGEAQELLTTLRKNFQKVKPFKPQSSRSESKETFFTALSFRGSNSL